MISETRLNALIGEEWKDLRDIVIFGFGRQGQKMYPTLNRDFNVLAIVDNSIEKQGTEYYGRRVESFEEAASHMGDSKIIVTTSQYYYQSIREQLKAEGLEENRDFVMYQQLITEWYYKYKNKIIVLKTIVPLTSRCTLRCENCMQFLPFWDKHRIRDNNLNSIISDLDIYFDSVDYVLNIDVVGGEPFLYRDIDDFIIYLGEHYLNRIGYVVFITNGMILPNEKTIQLISKYNMHVSISDYSNDLEYRHRIPELIRMLQEYKIEFLWNKNIDWFDFGFPRDAFSYKGDSVILHMRNCNSIEHILDDHKFFYCGLEWSAQKGGLFPINSNAYIDLEKTKSGEIDRKEILELLMGNLQGGYMEFCRKCGGFGIDNDNRVVTARQMR